jgi:hypothetical protein
MRTFLRALVLALAIGPLTPSVALCQRDDDDDDDFDDAPPPPRRVFDRPRRTWRDSPLVWGTTGVVLAVAIPFSVFKLIRSMRQWQIDQAKPKEPWQIAMEEAERNRGK